MELKLTNVTRQYGHFTALDSFTYVFKEGIYGLLGPNGAGKSTLMNLITGNLSPNGGSIYLDGENIHSLGIEYLKHIGYVPQNQSLYPTYTGRNFLYYMAALKGMSRKNAEEEISQILEQLHLTEQQDKKIKEYSGGMKQRLLIGQALLGCPSILVLDEPTAGLDPKERIGIRNILSGLSKDRIIIFATHVVSDVEKTAREILFLKKGILRQEKEYMSEWHDGRLSLEDIYMHIFGEEGL